MTTSAILEVEGLEVTYGGIRAVQGVSFSVNPGETVALIGANGAGKSSTLRAIAGLEPLRTGRIRALGQDLSSVPAHRRPGLGMMLVPEGRGILRRMTVLENLQLGLSAAQDRLGDPEAQAAALEGQLDRFPRLRERAGQLAGTLSGGEQQMLAMARALLAQPKLLLLDEPSMGLAPVLVDQVLDLVAEVGASGVSILLVEQNARRALEVASRGLVMAAGSLVLAGSSAKLLDDPTLRDAYLGHH